MKKTFLFALLLAITQSNLSAQCLTLTNCPASPVTFCDITPDTPEFWNDSLFLDPTLNIHDLGEAPADISLQVTNTCGGDLQAYFVLRLDLNNDGVMETAISSQNLPGADTVYFGNAANPNFTGGVVSHFDSRPVPASDKYAFALEKTTMGNVTTVRIRWTTTGAPGTYVVPQLPYGTHRIDWYFEKDGESKTCGNLFVVKDCKAPTVVCLPGFSTNIQPNHLLSMYATDFLQYAQDNRTPAQQLHYGIRRSGTGTGFPVDGQGNPISNVTFTCADLGTQPVELWAIDGAGNADYCETYIIIMDNNGNCSGTGIGLQVCAVNACGGVAMSEVEINLGGSGNGVPPFTMNMMLDSTGCIELDNSVPISSNVTITPVKDNNPLNGVSTYDLVLISRHILGLEPLNTPYKLIAADANKSGSITTFDIVELRKLILGVYQELPNNTSWRFVDSTFTFPNPQNPFQTAFPENVTVTNVQTNQHVVFYSMKIGDVNCNALNFNVPPPAEEALSIPNLHLQGGDVVEVPIQFLQAGTYYGLQFGLGFDASKIEVQQVIPERGTLANFGIFPDHINTSFSSDSLFTQLPDTPIYRLRIKALADVHLADIFSLTTNGLHAEAYPTIDSLVGLHLEFATVATTEPEAARTIFAPQPNPTNAGVCLPLRLVQSAPVRIEILDATGRLVYDLEQTIGTGAQLLDIPATAFPQPGMYFWRVTAGKISRAGKLVKQ